MRKIGYALLVFIIVLVSLGSCLSFRKSDSYFAKRAVKNDFGYSINYSKDKLHTIRYLHYQNENTFRPLLVFIHGAPGDLSALSYYIEDSTLRNKYNIMLVDRPGYGYSNYGKFALIGKQSEAIIKAIDEVAVDGQKVMVVGHSYGATVAGHIAIVSPSFLSASVMLAPAIDPKVEKYFWFGKLGKWKATRWMASKSLKVAADEKYSHAADLATFEDQWKNITVPIYHIHGDQDAVVPFANLDFSIRNIPSQYLTAYAWKGENHFFPFTKEEEVVKLLLEYFNGLGL